MALTAGTRLGPYEIEAPIGAGGMGEVYRAKDTRLERTVAVKILPKHLSSNEQLRQRFDREAKLISGLSHTNIWPRPSMGTMSSPRGLSSFFRVLSGVDSAGYGRSFPGHHL